MTMLSRAREGLRTLSAWVREHPTLTVDALWAVLLSPVILFASISIGWSESSSGLFGLLLGLGFTVPLVFRRTHAEAAALAVVATHLVQVLWTNVMLPANITAPMMLYAVVVYGNRPDRHRWWLAGALAGAALGGFDWGLTLNSSSDLAAGIPRGLAWTFTNAAVMLAVWFMGQWARQRRLNLVSLRERAEALQREHLQSVALATEEERSRIAREMHDVIAHSLSVIVVQSDGANYLASHGEAGDPEARLAQVTKAIETINQTAREALGETRRLVGVLRHEGESLELAPAATLDQIGDLVENLRAAGVPATFTSSGDPAQHGPLSAGAEMAAYRVVQESLTNVMKHAGPGATVRVTLDHRPQGVELRIMDTGLGVTSTDGAGHGVIGMRERMAAWGGTLQAGSRAGGGFEVTARLPAPPVPTSGSERISA